VSTTGHFRMSGSTAAMPPGDHIPAGGLVSISKASCSLRGRQIAFLGTYPSERTMTNKLGLEEALRKLAGYRRAAAVKREQNQRSEVRPAHRANANEEFQEPPSADPAWCVGILIALALIDWFVARLLS
jgi:hypothetical protein